MLKVKRDPETNRIRRLQTGDVMFSYAFLTTVRPDTDFKKGTYGADLIIQDEETLGAIKEYIQEVMEDAIENTWDGKLSKDLHIPLKKGDEESEIEAGHYVLKTTTKKQPKLLIRDSETGLAHEITEDEVDDIYSGMIGEAIIQLAPYNYNGKKGITCYLNAVCKTGDGIVLGGAASYEDEFSLGSDFDEGEEVAVKKPAKVKSKKAAVQEEPEDETPSLDALINGSVVTKGKQGVTSDKPQTAQKRPTIDELLK